MAAPDERPATNDDELVAAAALTLLRVLNKVQADRRVARRYGAGEPLTMIETEVCVLVGDRPGVTGAELAAALGVTASAVSQVVAKLTDKGHLEVSRDPDNRRVKHLALTASGRRAARHIRDHYRQMTTEVLGSSSPRDLRVTLRFLEDLESFLDQARTDP